MKVLHVLHTSHPNISGYSTRSKNIVEHQRIIGVNPIVVTSPRGPRDGSEVRYNGISYYRTETPNSVNFVKDLPFTREASEMLVVRKKLLEIMGNNQLELIHAHSPVLYGLPSLKVARKKSIPMVYEIRAFFEDSAVDRGTIKEGSMRYNLTRYLETRLTKKVDAVIGISSGICEDIISRGINDQKVHLVPNGVDTKRFAPVDKDFRLLDKYGLFNCVILGYIGSFFRFEGLDYLIKAMQLIKKEREDVKLLMVGGGDEESRIKKLTAELELEDSIIFAGRTMHEEILEYYSIIDILVYPRIRTRQTELVTPLKPLEAMSMAKAVICSDVGGLTELTKDGVTGLIFQSQNTNELKEKLLFLIDNEGYRRDIGLAARQDMVKNWDWSEIILDYGRIYKGISSKGS